VTTVRTRTSKHCT